jgi:hypothetical protein
MRVSILLLAACFSACARAERPPEPASCCVSSASVKPASDSPEICWTKLLEAMRGGDDAAIKRYTTEAGLASLEKGAGTEDKHTAFARWGKGWAAWEVRWKKRDPTRAEASLGPEAKEHGLVFVFSDGAWKLERWTPGE